MKRFSSLFIFCFCLAACAGRDPEKIQTVQAWDSQASCTQIRAEIEANNQKISDLGSEQGLKVAQNVGGFVAGLATFGAGWALMDAKGAAGTDKAALESRNKYLTVLATEKCAATATPPSSAPKR